MERGDLRTHREVLSGRSQSVAQPLVARSLRSSIGIGNRSPASCMMTFANGLPSSLLKSDKHVETLAGRLSIATHDCWKFSSIVSSSRGDVQALSQGLHSSTLEYLGIVAGLESLCRDFAAHHDVSVCFYPENIPLAVNKDLELGLYRIAQEALQNAGKHSGSGDFSVTLRSSGDELLLEVRDWGVGFSPKDAAREGGLGLISMKERVLLMSGSFSIESKANWGTRVTARVPLHGGLRDCGGGLTRKHGFNASSDFARAV